MGGNTTDEAVGGWRPIKDTHSIQACWVSIEFKTAVGDITWKRIEEGATAVSTSKGLLERTQVSMPDQLSQMPPDPVLVFSRRERPDFYSERLTLHRKMMRFEAWNYTRWAPFRARASDLMSPVFDSYAATVSVIGVQVQYVDKFLRRSSPIASVGEIVSESSPAVAAAFFRDNAAWHSDVGALSSLDQFTRRLAQTRVVVAEFPSDEGLLPTIEITTALVDQVNIEGLAPLVDAITWSAIEERFQLLHVALKEQFRSVLTSPAAAAVSLG